MEFETSVFSRRSLSDPRAKRLVRNGYALSASNEEVERFVLSVVVDKLDVASIAEWFKLHSKSL